MNHGELSRRVHFMKREAGGEEILCRISEGLMREGKREGRREGRREAKLESIIALMEAMKWDAEKAMDVLKIEREDRPVYAAFIKNAVGKPLSVQA